MDVVRRRHDTVKLLESPIYESMSRSCVRILQEFSQTLNENVNWPDLDLFLCNVFIQMGHPFWRQVSCFFFI